MHMWTLDTCPWESVCREVKCGMHVEDVEVIGSKGKQNSM